jgi:hypothetical protein
MNQHVDQLWKHPSVDHGLDLLCGPSGDVGDGPTSFLANVFLWVVQQPQQGRQGIQIQNELSLCVISSDDVPNGAQGWGLDCGGRAAEQFD